MIKLRNVYGETYYATEEENGTTCGTDYTKIYVFSEELGEKYGTEYRNAIGDSQPNIWTPYDLTDKELILYSDREKTFSYRYEIVK